MPLPTPSRVASTVVESRIADVGRDLARTFAGVLEAIPKSALDHYRESSAAKASAPLAAHSRGQRSVHRPQALARSLGVNTVLTSRILKAARQSDPLAVAHMIPGPEPLRRLLRAAERKKVDPALIREAREAVDRFEQLIDIDAGDRSALDALISGWLPDAREKVELIAKQSVFRGISQLLGTACEVLHCTIILHPSAPGTPGDSQFADAVSLQVTRGLRRVRPGLVVTYDTIHSATDMLTVTGEPVSATAESLHGLLLEPFCTQPLPELKVSRVGDIAKYTLCGDDVGVQSAVDLVHATFLPKKKPLHRAPAPGSSPAPGNARSGSAPGSPGDSPRRVSLAAGIGTPARTLIFDVLLHEDVYPGQSPALEVYQTAGVFDRPADGNSRGFRGGGDIDHRARSDADRIEVLEAIQPLGTGLAKFRAAETPDYQEMIRFVCLQRQWDTNKLRGYRCRIEYPIYSSEVVMTFELPAAGE
jgi:hypothetical protein